eukprot:TRINITY_DN581_c0_g1_i1.p1 TRINITY_DN581_c0_g1~~TRINITY_DN581_c0_g1_i1.p1  ORF type:complete len:194 (-),score=26.59 TRINITY_DN581_c0_g1_i1:238-819(-)
MRNEHIFLNSPIFPNSVKSKALFAFHEWNVSNLLSMAVSKTGLPPEIWLPPPANHVKLNFDGSFNPFSQIAGVGGIIHSSAGTLIEGYAEKVYASNSLEVELLAIIKGIEIFLKWGFLHVIIEGDCLSLTQSLQKFNNLSWALMARWRKLLHMLSQVSHGGKQIITDELPIRWWISCLSSTFQQSLPVRAAYL